MMQYTEIDRFSELMMGLGATLDKQVNPFMIELYWNALESYSIQDVKVAISRHLSHPENGKYFPKPADLIKALTGSHETQGMQAWSKVDQAVRRVGTYSSVVFDDPVIHQVISDMGGWIQLGKCAEDEWPFKAIEFEKRYRGYKQNPRPEYPRKLIGIIEMENSKEGYKVEPPMLIGDKRLCEGVYLNGAEKTGITYQPMQTLVNEVMTLIPNKQQEVA